MGPEILTDSYLTEPSRQAAGDARRLPLLSTVDASTPLPGISDVRRRLESMGAPPRQDEAPADDEGAGHPAREAGRSLLTLLFTDIVGSTRSLERMGNVAWQAVLLRHNAVVRANLAVFRGREVDHAGDGFFATFDGAGRAVRCAEAIRRGLEAIGIQIRVGIHAGECTTADGQVNGVAVHVAARVSGIARPGEILVTATLKDLVAGSGIGFSSPRRRALKGLHGRRELFSLVESASKEP
jgi:class 3 adenylate cyclase